MSVIKFELKNEHLMLLKHLMWGDVSEGTISTEGKTPFDGFDHYEDMGVILYGRPDDFDPFDGDPFVWSEEQIIEMDELLNELPTAIEVVLNAQTFEVGKYKTKFHNRDWKLISSKN